MLTPPNASLQVRRWQLPVIRTRLAQKERQTWHPVRRPRQRRHLRGDVGRGAGHDPVSILLLTP
nr:hypothetical protein [Oscillochloris trichoides]